MINAKQLTYPGGHILYDAGLLEPFDPRLFEPVYLKEQGYLSGQAHGGRGSALFFKPGDTEWVLRHYHRGGAVAKWLGDRYLWAGLDQSRAWREWYLLAQLCQMGLPVPQPVAARVQRSGLWVRADIITVKIPSAVPLAELLSQSSLPEHLWQQLGAMLRCFHDHGVWHADLNAHNIMLAEEQIYLIDFDRGQLRHQGGSWKSRNLQRLLRSLEKLAGNRAQFCFTPDDWQALLLGYRQAD